MSLAAPVRAEKVGIAVIVNDDIISTADVAERRDLIMATQGIPQNDENVKKITPRIVQSLIDEQLQLQEAKRQSLSVTQEELDKAIDDLSIARNQPPGTLKRMVEAKGLSVRSLENQIRAQLAWTKVVQRKLRRNVTIAQDEVQRAQQARAAAPGVVELKIAALSIPILSKEKEADAQKIAEEVAAEFKTGADMPSVATRYIGRPDIQFSPPLWVQEENLQPAMQQALRETKPGEVTPPLRSGNTIQFVQVLDKRTTKKQSDSTEIALKQITIPLPAKREKTTLAKLKATTATLRANPGSCTDENLPKTDLPAEVKFARTRMGLLNPEQRSVISHLDVGGVSEPLMTPEALRLVLLCEKIEPSSGNLPPADEVRQDLYSEKLELEAQKHLRNLRRDAFINIKEGV